MTLESNSSVFIQDILFAALTACERAAHVIRSVAESHDYQTVDKAEATAVHADFQTAADRGAEALIVGVFQSLFPSVKLVGEEGTDSAECPGDMEAVRRRMAEYQSNVPFVVSERIPADTLTVYIDPLDGTREFVAGNFKCVSTMIGVTCNARAIAGVIYRPFFNEAIFGCEGLGVFMFSNGTVSPLATFNGINIPPTLRAVTSSSRSSPQFEKRMKQLGDNVDCQYAGGAGWKMWLLLTRMVDVYYYPKGGMGFWDLCAGDALIRLAGGMLTEPDGKAIEYVSTENKVKSGVVASVFNEAPHQELCARGAA